jgi:hypothetical protein
MFLNKTDAMKYEYKFFKIELKAGIRTKMPKQEYHEVIERHAAEGWRFVQLFAPSTSGFGEATYFELIFERPAE